MKFVQDFNVEDAKEEIPTDLLNQKTLQLTFEDSGDTHLQRP